MPALYPAVFAIMTTRRNNILSRGRDHVNEVSFYMRPLRSCLSIVVVVVGGGGVAVGNVGLLDGAVKGQATMSRRKRYTECYTYFCDGQIYENTKTTKRIFGVERRRVVNNIYYITPANR